MSRYIIPLEDKEIVYGFDHIFYYFFQEFDLSEGCEDDGSVVDYDYENPRPGEKYFGHNELLDELQPYEALIPPEHWNAILGDLLI